MEKTISVTITRDELGGRPNPEFNSFIAGCGITKRLREKGIPVIGVGGILAVERGKLTIEHGDGLDGDEWTYTFIGTPVMHGCDVLGPHSGITLQHPLLPREDALRRELEEEL